MGTKPNQRLRFLLFLYDQDQLSSDKIDNTHFFFFNEFKQYGFLFSVLKTREIQKYFIEICKKKTTEKKIKFNLVRSERKNNHIDFNLLEENNCCRLIFDQLQQYSHKQMDVSEVKMKDILWWQEKKVVCKSFLLFFLALNAATTSNV